MRRLNKKESTHELSRRNKAKRGEVWKTLESLSLDSWAVVLALLAALLIRAGVLKHIPW